MCISLTSYSQIERVNVGDFNYMRIVDNNFTVQNVSYKDLRGLHVCSDEFSHAKIQPSLSISSKKTKKGIQKQWNLEFHLHSLKRDAFSLKKGDKVLIKLLDDSVITLVTSKVDINTDDYGTFLHLEINLPEVTINKISLKGVKKVRIETIPDVCDTDYENNEIGSFIVSAKKIFKDMSNPTTKKAF